jgi:probable HAF family extracellular repeat protein
MGVSVRRFSIYKFLILGPMCIAGGAARAQVCPTWPYNTCAIEWNGENISILGGLPGAVTSTATGVNNLGQLVGYSYVSIGSGNVLAVATEWSGGTVINLGGLTDGSEAFAINASGQVVGSGGNDGFAKEWSGGNTVDLGDLPGSIASNALGINDVDKIVGVSVFDINVGGGGLVGSPHATEWSGGNIMDLGGLPGSTGSVAYGINNAGQIVGASYFGVFNQVSVATEWSDGNIIDLGGEDSIAYAINNLGEVVGQNGNYAVAWSGGSMVVLGAGAAYAINDLGQIVGESDGSATEWSEGTITDLGGPPGSIVNVPLAINDFGQIAGYGTIPVPRPPFPVPERSTWAMMLLGFAGLGLLRFRARQRGYAVCTRQVMRSAPPELRGEWFT